MKYILTDIEGTTTSKDFVYQTLFPYSLAKMSSFILARKNLLIIQELIANVQKTVLDEHQSTVKFDDCINVLKTWIEQDRKHPALKTIQGMIWESGYSSGDLKGHLYPDVLPAFKAWKEAGHKIGIYSSGSALAQRLLFKYSNQGDLSSYISHYFDTAVGNKREASSYRNISLQLEIFPANILFLSDIAEELEAAKSSGFQVAQLLRDGWPAAEGFATHQDFSTIKIDS